MHILCATVSEKPFAPVFFASALFWTMRVIGRSPRRRFPDHAFMPHCTFSPHLLAQQGVRRAPEGEGVLTGGIWCNFANIGPRNSIQLLIRYAMCWKC